MTQNDNILQELKELQSSLAGNIPQNVYAVPDGYFENLAGQVLNRIRVMNTDDASKELALLSPQLMGISKQMPFDLPPGYFETLEQNLMEHVRQSEDYLSAKEELETISPLLSGVKKTMPYTVPQGYFENIKPGRGAKVVTLSSRKWLRYAAAAVITGVIVMAGFFYVNSRNSLNPVDHPYAWVKKSVKKVDTKDIDALVNLANEEQSVAANPVKPDEIKELMKDVSPKELQDFLENTPDIDNDEDSKTQNSDGSIMN